MNKSRMVQRLAACFLVAVSAGAGATVIDSADVAGLRTFQDQNTGRVWLDLNNFFDQSTVTMVAAANAAGFTFAARSDVEGLLNSLPLTGGEWPGYKAIMGDAPNRELIWGSYDDGGDPSFIGWAYSYSDTSWNFNDSAFSANDVPNGGSSDADMNIWAFQTGVVAVPEPGSLALLGLGLAGLATARRRKPA